MSTSEDTATVSSKDTPADPLLVAKIIKQVEFYFGDKNLPRDKFLLRILHEEGNEPGWVPLETLIIFNRLKVLSTDLPFIASALKQSTSELLEISEDNTKIRRKTSVPDIFQGDFFDIAKSVYAKGFPSRCTIDEMEEFFETFGKINLISLRKFKGGGFKGSVFVEFAEADAANAFVSKEKVSFKGVSLLRYMKPAYHEKKAVEYQELKKSKQIQKSEVLRVITRRDKPYLKGALVKLEGLSDIKEHKEIKETFGEDKLFIDFIELNPDNTECTLMFKIANGAVDAVGRLKTQDGMLKMGEKEVKYTFLEGEDGEKEWLRLVEVSNNVFGKMNSQSRRGRGRGRARGRGMMGRRSARGKFDRNSRRGNLGKRRGRDRQNDEDDDPVKNSDKSQSELPEAKHTKLAGSDED